VILEILILFLLIFCNAVLAFTEIALVSSDVNAIDAEKQKGNNAAKQLLVYLKNPESYLSPIQLGITLVGVAAGAFGGFTFSEPLTPFMELIIKDPVIAERSGLVLIIVGITYFNITLGELFPKKLAITNPEKFAIRLLPLVKILSTVFYPAVKILNASVRLINKLLQIEASNEKMISEDSIRFLIMKARKQGTLEEKEHEMLQNIFRFANRKAYQIMTPAEKIVWLNLEDPYAILKEKIKAHPFSKFPVGHGSLDDFAGFVSIKDFFESALHEDLQLEQALKQPLFVNKDDNAIQILEKFESTRIYMAAVKDEINKTLGIITLHDLTEGIFGELPYPDELIEDPIIVRQDGSLLVDGSVLIDEILEALGHNAIFSEEERFIPIAEWFQNQSTSHPTAGMILLAGTWKLEIVDMDGLKIDKLMVHKTKNKDPD
jgi:putative hemolysin